MILRSSASFGAMTVALCVLLVACKKSSKPEEQGVAPPPIASSKPGACQGGGATVTDSVAAPYVPRVAGDYCLDPNSEQKAYGENSSTPLDAVCNIFDGECEVYKRYGLRRVFQVRYIDGKGSPGIVQLNLSRFSSPEAAYAFFTKRVVADGDPLETAPKPLEAGAAAGLGSGVAYVYRGDLVGELSYVNELESQDQLMASSPRVLPPIAKELGEKLPGDKKLPRAVLALPQTDLLPNGISYEFSDLFGVSGVGRGAVGYYRSGGNRYRLAALVREDEAGAKDVMGTLKKLPGARVIKDQGFDALAFPVQDGDAAKIEWVAGRMGATVIAAGDEGFALAADAGAKLGESDKLEKVKAALDK
jgi:hypothetical protein